MGYDTLIRGLIKNVVSPQFETMKMDITFKAWIGQSGSGKPEYATPRTIRGLVDFAGRGAMRYTSAGVLIMQLCVIQFVDIIGDTTPNTGQDRSQPVDGRDILTLPDGSTAPVADTGGFGDSGTGQPFALSVTLGTVVRGQ